MNGKRHGRSSASRAHSLACTMLGLGFLAVASGAENVGVDTNRIEELTGLKGTFHEEEGVFKVTAPRTDVQVAVDRWPVPPFMGLTSWAGFCVGKKEELMVMGDLVLMEDEVNPVMTTALETGLSVTALHNHFFFDDPKVYFMHIAGEGKAVVLPVAVKNVLDRVKEIRAANPNPAKGFGGADLPKVSSITVGSIEEMLGAKGESREGIFKVIIGRKTKVPSGSELGKEMGVNTWAAFAGSDDNAVVDGDFAVREDELQPVLRILRRFGFQIVAIHHHLTHENPRFLFVHYWGRGRVKDMGYGLKAALDAQAKIP